MIRVFILAREEIAYKALREATINYKPQTSANIYNAFSGRQNALYYDSVSMVAKHFNRYW